MRCCALSPWPPRTQAATAARSPTGWAQQRPSPRCLSKVSSPAQVGQKEVSLPPSPLLTQQLALGDLHLGHKGLPPLPHLECLSFSPVLQDLKQACLLQEDPHHCVLSSSSSRGCIPFLARTSRCQRLLYVHKYPGLLHLLD